MNGIWIQGCGRILIDGMVGVGSCHGIRVVYYFVLRTLTS